LFIWKTYVSDMDCNRKVCIVQVLISFTVQAVPYFHTEFIPENMYESQTVELCVIRESSVPSA
jgi:hypothetical protein